MLSLSMEKKFTQSRRTYLALKNSDFEKRSKEKMSKN